VNKESNENAIVDQLQTPSSQEKQGMVVVICIKVAAISLAATLATAPNIIRATATGISFFVAAAQSLKPKRQSRATHRSKGATPPNHAHGCCRILLFCCAHGCAY
jgi:hypothetical protein